MKLQSTNTIHESKIKIVIYGVEGSGKTSSIKTLDHKRTLVISAERGLLSLSGTDIKFVDIATDDAGKVLSNEGKINRLNDVVKFLNTKEAIDAYDNVVLDSLTDMGEVIACYWKEKITDKAKSFELWGKIGETQINFIKSMRDNPNYNVVFICLEDLDKDETSRRYYAPALPGNTAKNFLIPAFDEVLRVCVEPDGRRYVQTQPLATVKAKDRSGKLNPQEPLDLGLILNKIKGEKK
jgi:phage nucleotide-binding protein